MKRIDVILTICLFALLLGTVFYKNRAIFEYKFNPSLVSNYLRSQDIEDVNDQIKDRIFVSDSTIYVGAGYLYAKGSDPTAYNFQHPPLIKYLFGYSTLIFKNPYVVQLFFGLLIIFLTYLLGFRIFNSRGVGLLASIFLILDPVFISQIGQTLLDLGQSAFALLYFLLAIFYPGAFVFQGLVLGLFAASKFWSTTIIFVAIIWGYKFFLKRKEIEYRKLIYSFLIAFVVFSLTYLKTFIDRGGLFNIFFFEARVLRFMLEHNAATVVGGSIVLYLTGYFVKWWGNSEFVHSTPWSFFWPATFFVALFKSIFSKKDLRYLVFFLPVVYLFLTVTQAPFTRYFVIVLPFFYLSFSAFLLEILGKYTKSKIP